MQPGLQPRLGSEGAVHWGPKFDVARLPCSETALAISELGLSCLSSATSMDAFHCAAILCCSSVRLDGIRESPLLQWCEGVVDPVNPPAVKELAEISLAAEIFAVRVFIAAAQSLWLVIGPPPLGWALAVGTDTRFCGSIGTGLLGCQLRR